MKILYHHRIMSKDGQDVHVEEMLAAFRSGGNDIAIAAPKAMEQAEFGFESGWVDTLKRLIPKAIYEILEAAYSLQAYRRLRRVHRLHPADFVYERYNLHLFAGLWLKRRDGVPLILEINAPLVHERSRHGGLALERFARWAEATVWRGADYCLPVTDVLAEHVRAAGVPEARICVIHNGANRARFPAGMDGAAARKELGIEGKLVLGFTGFIRSWHGLPAVVDVMADYAGSEELYLLVVGDGPAREELEAHARARGMEARVKVLGVVARDRVANYIAAFDIALQPSVVDYASPLKMFEYMALGRAIVAPDQANIREILEHEATGLLFDPAMETAFPAAVARLLDDASLRERLGAGATAAIENRGFTWLENARRVVALAKKSIGLRSG